MNKRILGSINSLKDQYRFLTTENSEIWVQGDGNKIAISSIKDLNHLTECILLVRRISREIREYPYEVYNHFLLKLNEIEENLKNQFDILTDI